MKLISEKHASIFRNILLSVWTNLGGIAWLMLQKHLCQAKLLERILFGIILVYNSFGRSDM